MILLSDVLLVTQLMFCLWVLDWLFSTYVINRGAVYYPSTREACEQVLEFLKIKKGQKVMDLGAGDGIFLFEAAKRGVKAIGYELDPVLVMQVKKKIKRLGLENLIEIRKKNMYEADFDEADVVYCYQFPKYMKKIVSRIRKKSKKKKTVVVSNRYEIPDEKWVRREGKVMVYEIGA